MSSVRDEYRQMVPAAAAVGSWQAYADYWHERARYEDSRGDVHSADVARRKAAIGEQAVRASELEAETGVPHCVCCLKPTGPGGRHA